jgi:hypothetical protein
MKQEPIVEKHLLKAALFFFGFETLAYEVTQLRP